MAELGQELYVKEAGREEQSSPTFDVQGRKSSVNFSKLFSDLKVGNRYFFVYAEEATKK